MISGPPHTRRAFSWDKAPKAILPLAPPGRGPAPRPALRGGSAPFAVPGSPSKKTPLPPLRRRGVWCIIIQTIWPGTGVGGPRGRPTPPKRKRQAVCGEVGRKSRAVPPLSQSDRRACRVQLHDGWMRAAYLSCLCRGRHDKGSARYAFLARPCSGERVALFSQGHFAKLQSGDPSRPGGRLPGANAWQGCPASRPRRLAKCKNRLARRPSSAPPLRGGNCPDRAKNRKVGTTQ